MLFNTNIAVAFEFNFLKIYLFNEKKLLFQTIDIELLFNFLIFWFIL